MTAPKRVHLTRLMSIWRSAGWPCRDAIEVDLLAAGWAEVSSSPAGHECLRLTEAGIRLLAASRQRNQRALSTHDRLAEKMALQLLGLGRIVWRELSLLAEAGAVEEGAAKVWRSARPDVFSIRNTTVAAYLQPMVHEIKVSRADLLSDLRHAAKRASYQWLSCETCYVFPAGIAQPEEIPEAFGIWVLNGAVDGGQLELVRPARHTPCELPFAVWMALAKATPVRTDDEPAQGQF
ncbi:MAG TPA: hypothetical protein VGM74_08905 [Burkholderiaceae bacterium]